MKNKEEKKNRIWVPIVIGALACSAAVGTGIALTHNQQRPKAGTVATMSDAADISGLTTEVAGVTTEEATTEATLEVVSNEKPEAVPATTEIGGGKKKAEETTEEKKSNTTESTKPSTNHSNNSGSANSGQSTTPKPSSGGSNSGGNSGSSNSSNSNSTPSPKPSTPATTEAPTSQHQHNYNVWVKTKDAWNETVIDTPEQTIDYPEQGYYVDTMACHTCGRVFTSLDSFTAHATYGGGSCSADGYGSADPIWVKTRDPYTETIPAKTHTVHHDEEGYWKCECGARK